MKMLLIILFNFISSCALFIPQTEPSKVDQKPITIRRKIKDIDYRTWSEDTSLKKRIVVLPFVDKDPTVRTELTRARAKDAFINALNEHNQYIVLDAQQLTVDSQKYLVNGEYDLKKLAVDSSKSGVNVILEGKIIDVKLIKKAEQIGLVRNLDATYEVVVRLKMQNVRTNQEIFHTVKTVTLEEKNTRIAERVSQDQLFVKNPELVEILIKDAFLDFTTQINQSLNEVTWEGRIAAIRGDKIYLNVGQVSGVQVGDLLKVVEDSSEVYDPEIGYNLGKVPGKSKGTLEIISYFGQDGSVGIIHSGAGFKESDRVEVFK